jgi:hypothetical protein
MWNNPAEISNCTVSSSIIGGEGTGGSTRTGGIVGHTAGGRGGHVGVNITNCTVFASGSISAGSNLGGGVTTGGIAGQLGDEEDSINGCTNEAPVTKKDAEGATGGLVGVNSGKIHTSLNTGNVTAPHRETGGLVGTNYSSGNVYSCCTNRGYVNGQCTKLPRAGYK